MVAAQVILGLAMAMPTVSWAGREGLTAMLVAQSIALLSNFAGGVPAVWGLSYGKVGDHRNLLGGMMLRVVVLALLAIPAGLSDMLATKPLLLWLAGSYFVALMVETAMVATWIQQAARVEK